MVSSFIVVKTFKMQPFIVNGIERGAIDATVIFTLKTLLEILIPRKFIVRLCYINKSDIRACEYEFVLFFLMF